MVENSYYERKIKYLDLMESGERTGSAGFIKIEVKGMGISLLVNVKGLHPTDTYEREVMLQTEEGESSIGRITLKEGQGQFQYHMVMDHSQLRGIRIALGGTREISCKWQEKKRVLPETTSSEFKPPSSGAGPLKEEKQGSSQKPREIQVIPWDEVRAVEESLERVERIMSKPEDNGAWEATEKTVRPTEKTIRSEEKTIWPAEKTVSSAEKTMSPAERTVSPVEKIIWPSERTVSSAEKTMSPAERTVSSAEKTMSPAEKTVSPAEKTIWPTEKTMSPAEKTVRPAEKTMRPADKTTKPVRRSASGSTLGSAKRPVRLMEDKWQQIWAIYPHIHPFQDEREYLSISPADFVLLPEEAYRAANNSFLLHGYYNYDHLILTKIEKRGEVSYYIGVPGNYYEREKQVAIMFGFESFECGTEPAQAGDFGYYMMRTQL